MKDETIHLPADRLAHALGVTTPDLERALIAVGVDADYLVRALYEGDPQGTYPAVAERLGTEKPDLVLGVVKALVGAGLLDPDGVPGLLDAAFRHVQQDEVVKTRRALAHASRALPAPGGEAAAPEPAPAEPASTKDADARALAHFLGNDLPRLARRARVYALVLGGTCLALGALGFLNPGLFRAVLWVLASGGLLVGGLGLLVAARRLHRASRALGAFADAVTGARDR